MTETFGLPQLLTGAETVTIHQMQNGQIAKCTMPLSQLVALIQASLASALPKSEPTTAGVLWDNAGAVSIS